MGAQKTRAADNTPERESAVIVRHPERKAQVPIAGESVAIARNAPTANTTVDIDPAAVTTFAGSGTNSNADGTGAAASFADMTGMVVVGTSAYVVATSAIRRVDLATGVVTTLAGSLSQNGCLDNTDPATVRFGQYQLGDIDSDGTYLYVYDANCGIRKVSIATGATSSVTGPGSYVGGSITVGPDGYLYVAGSSSIDRMDPTNGSFATFYSGSGSAITSDATYLWVEQLIGLCTVQLLRIALADGSATTFGLTGSCPKMTGTTQLASAGSYLYAPNPTNNGVERITKATGAVVQIAGTASPGYADGTGTDAWLSSVTGIGSDGTTLWVADSGNHRFRKLVDAAALPKTQTPNAAKNVNIFPGKVTTAAGSTNNATVDGQGTAASFKDMGGTVIVGNYAYQATQGAIRKIDLTTNPVTVSTLAGEATATGCVDSPNAGAARFAAYTGYGPTMGAMDSDGYYLYVYDGICGIRRVSLATGATSTITTAVGGELTVGPDGYVYVAGNSFISRIDTANGTVTTNWLQYPTYFGGMSITSDANYLWVTEWFAPSYACGNWLYRINVSDASSISYHIPNFCSSIAGNGQIVSAGKYVYVSSPGDHGVERISKRTGSVGSIAGGLSGNVDGEWSEAKFNAVTGLTSDGANLWVADSGNHTLRKIVFAPLRARELGATSSHDASVPRAMAGDPIDTSSGNYSESFTDVSLPGLGMPFTFTRYYNSLFAAADSNPGRFGVVGWTDSFDASVEQLEGGAALVHMPSGQSLRFEPNGQGGYSLTPGVYDQLTTISGLFVLTQPDKTSYHFDPDNRLAYIADRNGFVITLHWDGPAPTGRVDYITDTVGRQISFTYDPTCGFLSRITLPDGRYAEYTYTGSCQLAYAYELDADGLGRKFTHYTWNGFFISSIDRGGSGNIVYNTYDQFTGKVQQQQDATTLTTYDYSGGTTTVTHNGHSWVYVYDQAGRLLSVTDPNNNVTTYSSFDVNNNPQQISQPGGQIWNYSYNDVGKPLTVTPPIASNAVTYSYDQTFHSFPMTMTDGNGRTTRWVYTSSGDLSCKILPTSSAATCAGATQADKISYTYDANHQLRTVTDPNGHVTTYDYFASTSNPQKLGLLKSVTTPLGLKTSFDYNSFLQRTTMVTPQGNANGGGAPYTWNCAFDDAGRPSSVTPPAPAGVTSYFYDAEGNLISTTDADNHTVYRGYLPGGKPCFVALGVSGTCASPPYSSTSYTYDADGNMNTVTDGDRHTTTYLYWPNGQLKSMSDPLLRVWSHALLAHTPTTSTLVQTLPSGDTATSTSDAMDRVTSVAYSTPGSGFDPTTTQQYAYWPNGQLCYAALNATPVTCTSTSGIKFSYDNLDRMTSAGLFSYAYVGNSGLIKSRTYPDTRVLSYTYDNDDRLCGIKLTLAPATTCTNGTVKFDYSQITAALPKLTKTFPLGQTVTTFDNAGRTTSIMNKTGSGLTTLSSYGITLSPAGYPTTVAVTNTGLPTGLTTETQAFTYNPQTGRLQKVCYDVAQCGTGTSLTGVGYNYDGAGNTISKTTYGAGAGTTYYGFDAANELCWAGATFGDPSSCTLPSGDTAYTYTANGDRLGFGTTALRYDLAHRLTKATIGSTAHTFTYDALGNRSKDTGPTTATTTTYDWDPNGSLPMMASAKLGSTQKDFFYGGGLQAMRQGSTIYYYDKDQTGSASNILKANGTLEYSYSYQPYGQFRSNNKNDSTATNNFNPMVFDSEYADIGTTGFVDLRAREYDPSTGTFLTSDPIGKSPDFTFAGGNPAMFSDPSGKSFLSKALDWFNEHINPGYHYLQACLGGDGSGSFGSWLAGCATASTVLAATAVGLGELTGIGAEETFIYRGVAEGHHAFDDALEGIARPGDILGDADAFLHNQGFTSGSRLTSWTTDRAIAEQFAGKGGVVLRTTIEDLQARGINVLLSPDAFGEAEVLVEGLVDRLEVLPR